MPPGTEVLVAGAGPAGCVAALLLARLGARVALVADLHGADARPLVGEVLPAAARRAFDRLGLGALLDDPSHRPSAGVIATWGPGEPSVTDGPSAPLGPGLQLDRRMLDAGLREAARAAGALVVVMPRAAWPALGDAPRRPNGPAVVVDASGRAASVARTGGWTLDRPDRLIAIVGTLAPPATEPRDPTDATEDGWLRVAGTADGWWSTMVLPDGRLVAAFHSDAGQPAARAMADPDRWWSALSRAPALATAVTARHRYPPARLHIVAADSRRRRPPASAPGRVSRIMPVGDAEMAFDPLSSFGILGAISSAEEALPVIAARMDSAGAARAADALREAARERRWARYRERLAAAYAEETRWPSAPFWAERQTARSSSSFAISRAFTAP